MGKRTSEKAMKNKNISLFWEFFKIGMFTIGGGMAIIPQIQQVVVENKKWLTEEEMIDCIAISQSMPGVIAINSATYIGNKISGIKGSLSATLGAVMPSFMIIIAVVVFLGAIGDNSYLQGAFTGIKAAICALILVSAVRLGRQILRNAFQWILAAASFAVVGIFGVTAVWVILAGGIAGLVYTAIRSRTLDEGENEEHDGEDTGL